MNEILGKEQTVAICAAFLVSAVLGFASPGFALIPAAATTAIFKLAVPGTENISYAIASGYVTGVAIHAMLSLTSKGPKLTGKRPGS